MQTIRIGKQLITADQPLIMGILNLTPDSFYDGGKYNDLVSAMSQIQLMIEDGLDILDLGAFSSRPGATMVPASKQIEILRPVVKEVLKLYPELPLSIDTCYADVVHSLAELTSFIVNDISGSQWDDGLLDAVSRHKLPYVAMHIHGTPETMQDNPQYEDVCMQVLKYLANFQTKLRKLGITDVIIDPGFGFGKTVKHNYQLLSKLEVFQILDSPVLIGLSRKYDVKEAVETRNLWLQLQSSVND